MKFQVFTLFPELIESALKHGVVGQSLARGDIALEIFDPRARATGGHNAVDDRPFGGGDGMTMLPEIVASALEGAGFQAKNADHESRLKNKQKLICLSARGARFDDQKARAWAKEPGLSFFCGRYAGIDQRAIVAFEMEEVSLGDFVLSGGEFAALAMIDAVARFLPGTLGNSASAHEESFASGLLEEPQFTRPKIWRELEIPAVLASGAHGRVEQWRRDLSLLSTAAFRSDLLRPWAVRSRALFSSQGASPAVACAQLEKRVAQARKTLDQMSASELEVVGFKACSEKIDSELGELNLFIRSVGDVSGGSPCA